MSASIELQLVLSISWTIHLWCSLLTNWCQLVQSKTSFMIISNHSEMQSQEFKWDSNYILQLSWRRGYFQYVKLESNDKHFRHQSIRTIKRFRSVKFERSRGLFFFWFDICHESTIKMYIGSQQKSPNLMRK